MRKTPLSRFFCDTQCIVKQGMWYLVPVRLQCAHSIGLKGRLGVHGLRKESLNFLLRQLDSLMSSKHVAHGDAAPGYNATNMPGFKFGSECAVEDIDECANWTDNCDINAARTNTIGSFTCACNDGYVGRGNTCNPSCAIDAGDFTALTDAIAAATVVRLFLSAPAQLTLDLRSR